MSKDKIMTVDEFILDLQTDHFRDILAEKGQVAITVRGTSMWPYLVSGDVVTIIPAALSDIGVGDIVFTYVNSSLLCHRVFRKGRDYIQTKPDAFLRFDCKVGQDQIVGKVISRQRNGRITRTDSGFFRCTNWVISRLTLFLVLFYPLLRFLKHRVLCNVIGKI